MRRDESRRLASTDIAISNVLFAINVRTLESETPVIELGANRPSVSGETEDLGNHRT